MRSFYPVLTVLLLAACAQPTVQEYAKSSNKRIVDIDGSRISVVPSGWHSYVAWGGTKDTSSVMRYRQRRAIELVSGCRIGKGMSHITGELLQADVSC